MNPKISIIIPTYNRAHLIGETLDSVLAQTYQDWECIVVDDGSTDNTEDVVSKYIHKNPRIKFMTRSDNYKSGGNGARNFGWQNASSEWILFLDSDDLLKNSCLALRAKNVEKNPKSEIQIYHSGLFENYLGDIDRLWNILQLDSSNNLLLKRFLHLDIPWPTNGAFWNISLLQKIDGWNEDLKNWQDWEIHIHALTLNPVIYIDNSAPDNFVRLDSGNNISAKKTSLKYLMGVVSAIRSVEDCLEEKDLLKFYQKEFRVLIVESIIRYPLKLGGRKNVLKVLRKFNWFKSINGLALFSNYLICELYRSTKVKLLFKKLGLRIGLNSDENNFFKKFINDIPS